MTCDICREREATLFLQQTINGNDRRVQICGQCAKDIQEGTIEAESLEKHELIEEARELMQNVGQMNMGMDDNFLQPFRDLMRRFNRPAIERRERSFWDSSSWMWPFGYQAMRPMERISLPDPETRMREDRASRLVFNDDGTVSLRGEGDGQVKQSADNLRENAAEKQSVESRKEEAGGVGKQTSATDSATETAQESKTEASATDSSEETKHQELSDVELSKMDFGELMHYTDDVSAEERKVILARRRDLAVREEDYELAAEIRDALKSLS